MKVKKTRIGGRASIQKEEAGGRLESSNNVMVFCLKFVLRLPELVAYGAFVERNGRREGKVAKMAGLCEVGHAELQLSDAHLQRRLHRKVLRY